MRDGYAIRLAVASDLPRLPEIERSAAILFEDFALAELFARLLTPLSDLEEGLQKGRLWVATARDDAVVGFALACAVGGNAHLDELDVLPAHGRRGIGGALVESFLRWAQDLGFPGATLITLQHVPWNAPFYQRFGFRTLEPRELPPALSQLLRREVERGLPAENRVAMYRPIPHHETDDGRRALRRLR
jgi:GNAT superfamily N-acetyltransferase